MSARVYASLPLAGPAGAIGRDILRGAQLALERSGADVELLHRETHGVDREVRAVAHARAAAEDARALAYLGDLHSSQVAVTAPILSAAGLLQVAPVATYAGLAGATLVRLMPHDGMLAESIAGWLSAAGVSALLVVHDHDDGYGVPVGRMCVKAVAARGIAARGRPVPDHADDLAGNVTLVQAVLYAGVAGSGAAGLFDDLHARDSRLWLLGTDGVAAPWLAAELEPGTAERVRFFSAQRGPWGFYGYEAMALILAAAGADRTATVRAARSPAPRDSPLGPYAIDGAGLTTRATCGRLAIIAGQLVWDG